MNEEKDLSILPLLAELHNVMLTMKDQVLKEEGHGAAGPAERSAPHSQLHLPGPLLLTVLHLLASSPSRPRNPWAG